MAVQLVLFFIFHLLHNAVSQTNLSSNVTTDPICPDTPVVFTCAIDDVVILRWLVANSTNLTVLGQYLGEGQVMPMLPAGIEAEPNAQSVGGGGGLFDYRSTLSVSAASVLVDSVLADVDTVVCDGGGIATEDRQTVELRSFPMSPQYNCTLPGEGILRLNWIDTGDTVTEYRECVCDSTPCSCVPSMTCGSTSVCERNLAVGQMESFRFTAVNCGDQESSVSTLTTAGADVPAAPVFSEVRIRYDQSTGGLTNIMATWNRMATTVVVMNCSDLVVLQYTVNCGGSSLVDLDTNCDSSTCSYELSPSSGCPLSVTARNAVGMSTSDTSSVPDTTPLTVEVSDGTITCMDCNILYGTNPIDRNLPAVSGQLIPGLLPNETYFYIATQTTDSQVVEVEGSFTIACDCLDLIVRQLFNPLPMCLDGGDAITGAISNGGVTYTNLAVNSGTATYQCDDGFSILDDNSRECQGNGSWSGTLPTCQKKRKSIIGAIIGGVVGAIAALLVAVVVGILVYWFCCRDMSKGSGRKPVDERELRERTRSAEAPPDEETAPTYADPNMIERQPAPDSQDVYTVVDKAKKAPKPEDQLQTYQTPESILREAAPATGELYTVPEAKKGSKKKKEATPAEYSEVDMKKKHQPPSGLLYSELNLPPSGKVPTSKPVEYTDIQPHS